VIVGLDVYSFDIVEPYVNKTAKDAIERMLRAILDKLAPPPPRPQPYPAPKPAGEPSLLLSRKKGQRR
jgi:hypothetical protein